MRCRFQRTTDDICKLHPAILIVNPVNLKLLDEAARNPMKEAIDTTGLEYDRVCRNPKCITQTEQELPQLFRCTDKAAGIHRCVYCEQRA